MINNTMYLTGGKSPNPLSPPTNLAAKAGNAQVTLTWTDPPNATSEPSGQTIATWAYTQVVRKEGSQPTGPNDGTLVVKSSVRDQYQTTGYIDTNLTNDTTYYYGAFAYNSDGVYSEGAFVSATPRAGTPIGNLAEGTLITIQENGAPVEFYVADHDYQSDLNGTGRTLILRKDIHSNQSWSSVNNVNAWDTSYIRNWLNSAYIQLFSAKVQSLIGSTSYFYTSQYPSSTIKTISDPIFLVSIRELGITGTGYSEEGVTIPNYSTYRIAYLNGEASNQWTRSPSVSNTYSMYFWYNGNIMAFMPDSRNGARPCFTLPSTALVDTNNALIES